MKVTTVKIRHSNPRGFALINESDFDPKKHTKFSDVVETKEPSESTEEAKEADSEEMPKRRPRRKRTETE